MFPPWFVNGRLDVHPIADRADLAEGHARLGHAKRSGIHAEKDHPLAAVGKLPKVRLVAAPRITERIINVCDGRREFDAVNSIAEFACGSDHWVHEGVDGHTQWNFGVSRPAACEKAADRIHAIREIGHSQLSSD